MTKAALLANINSTSFGTVSNVNVTSGVNAFAFSGGPITNSGTIQLFKNNGTTGQYLRGDGQWASGMPLVKLSVSTTVSTTLTNTYTFYKLTYNAVNFDPDNAYSVALSRYTVPAGGAGTYLIHVVTNCRLAVAGEYYDVVVYKNGIAASGVYQGNSSETTYAQAQATVLFTINLLAGEYIEIFGKAESATASRSANYLPAATNWTITKLASL